LGAWPLWSPKFAYGRVFRCVGTEVIYQIVASEGVETLEQFADCFRQFIIDNGQQTVREYVDAERRKQSNRFVRLFLNLPTNTPDSA